jgi:uncharacterized protein YkwD
MGLDRRGGRLHRSLAVLLSLGLWWAQAGARELAPESALASWPDALGQPFDGARPLLVIPSGAAREDPASGVFEMVTLSAPPSVSPLPGSGLDADMLRTFRTMVNAIRADPRRCGSAGFFRAAGPVDYDERLASASLAHVSDMVERDYFAHDTRPSPEHPRGLTLSDRVRAAGYPWAVGRDGIGTAVAEVIGRGHRSFRQVLEGWLASPSHCAALMAPTLREFGVAARFRPDDVPVWGMVLARPPR